MLGYKAEQVLTQIGEHELRETGAVKLLGIAIDNNLELYEHLQNICLKAKEN